MAQKKDVASGYDRFKTFEGRKYTGMKVGGRHRWIYPEGQWDERKVEPDLWEFTYRANKRRKGRAPEGSGAPVGTKYHWYIVASQEVEKLDANTYRTEMVGVKHKVAHARAATGKWNVSERTQQRRILKILEDAVARLRASMAVDEMETAPEAETAPTPPRGRRTAPTRTAATARRR